MTNDKVLNRADFLLANDVEFARVPGFKVGTTVVIRSVSAGDMIEWSEANEGEAKKTAGLRLIVKSVVDGEPGVDENATGSLMLSMEDLEALRKKTHKTSENIVKAILKLNGMTVKQDAAAKND